MTEQLAFDLEAALRPLLAELADPRRRPVGDGAARLLVTLVELGLDEGALVPAAGLVISLEVEAAARRALA